jgi:hypothetical protein
LHPHDPQHETNEEFQDEEYGDEEDEMPTEAVGSYVPDPATHGDMLQTQFRTSKQLVNKIPI